MIEISFRQFYGNEHKKIIAKLEKSWINLHDLTEFAKDFGINDIFQDNGAKILQQLVYLNMKLLPGREGNDCVSASGREWEMKSINLDTTASGFSTNHHLTKEIIENTIEVENDENNPDLSNGDIDDIEAPDDFAQQGRLPIILDSIELLKNEHPDVPVIVGMAGPFTLAGHLVGVEDLVKM